MAEICPPKHTPEYKELLRVLGSEKEVYKVWMAFGEKLPSMEELTKSGIIKEDDEKPKFQSIIDTYVDRRSYLYKKLASINSKIKETSGENRASLVQSTSKLKTKISELNDKIEKFTTLNTLEDIYKFGHDDLNEVSKVLSSPELTLDDLQGVTRIIKLWKRVTQLDERNPIFNENEIKAFQNPENETFQNIAKELKNIQIAAEVLDNRWYKLTEEIVKDEVRKTFGDDVEVDYNNIIKDISKLSSRVLDIGEVDNILLKAMFAWNKKATFNTLQEWNKINHNLKDVMKVIYKRFNNKELGEIFAQTQNNTDLRKTGNIVGRFSQSFFVDNELRRKKYEKLLEDAEGNDRKTILENKSREYKENNILFDARKLFPREEDNFTDEEINNHKKELIDNLGEKGYEFYLSQLKDKIDRFNEEKEAEEIINKDIYGDDIASYNTAMEQWTIENSPYIAAEAFYENKTFKSGGEYVSPSFFKSIVIPKRYNSKGEDNGYYDNKFERIENDKDLYALYTYLTETIYTLNKYLPEDIKREIHSNTLPFVKKKVMEGFLKDGLFQGFSRLNDLWVEATRTGMEGVIEPTEHRDIEGDKIRQLQFKGFVNNKKVIQDYIARKTIEYEQREGKSPSAEDIIEFRKQIEDEISKEKSFDLEGILKVYSLAVLKYKHRAMIEDSMAAVHSIINNSIEQQLTNAGEPIKDKWGKPKGAKGLENLRGMVDHFMNYFYGYPTALKEHPFGKKIYITEEKRTKQDIEKLKENNLQLLKNGEIDKVKYLQTEEELDRQLASIGGVKTISGLGDIMNMFIRIKGLGWNTFAPIMNINFGYLSNIIEASGGTRFNIEELHFGYIQTLFNSKKVTAIAEKLDNLKEIQNEVYGSKDISSGWKKRIAPFYLTNKAEYLNQTPVMVAMMKRAKVKVNGKEMFLYDAYDKEGNLPNNIEFLDKGIVKSMGEAGVKIKIDQTLAMIHGNYDYDKPIGATQTILERSLMIFRKWMIMSYHNRLSGEYLDPILGMSQKGRWRSYSAYFQEYGAFGGIFQGTLNLLKKLAFQKTNFDKLNEVDAANMRKNLTEIMSLMAISALALLLRGILSGHKGDDDEGNLKYLCYFYINQLSRAERDIMFYIDPQQFKSILRDPLPIMGVVGDTYDMVTKSFNLVTGGEDTYKTGYRKGQSKTWVAVKKFIPPLSNIDRVKSVISQDINK